MNRIVKAAVCVGVLCASSFLYLVLSSIDVTAQDEAIVFQEKERFQISAWSYAGNPSSPTPSHGAYVIDKFTGRIWLVSGGQAPTQVGAVK